MSGARVCEAGDAALLLELDPIIDERVSARALAASVALRAAGILGVTDIVPTFRSVAVYFDPGTTEVDALRRALIDASRLEAPLGYGRSVEVPVRYGGAEGADLEAVASWAGLSPVEVIGRHAERTYRVFMLGFLPGFAYMGRVDASIAMPRKATPRLRVPPGSVGIAGEQTGVYPMASPGGWNLIGRSPAALFDPHRTPASWLAPGDHVRFVPMMHPLPDFETARPEAAMAVTGPRVVITRPGLHTTIQDRGRHGHQAEGVPVSGAMDLTSHDQANLLVGNAPDAATLEATIQGPEIRFEQDTVVGLAGADLGASLDGVPVPMGRAVPCRSGARLRFGERQRGARTYVAFGGGLGVIPLLGSRSTHPGAGLGPLGGRALRAGDVLPLGSTEGQPLVAMDAASRRMPAGGARVRVLQGPQDGHFPEEAFEVFQRARFIVSPQSNRMGYRLSGPAVPRRAGLEMISDAAFTGGIQIPPSGEPILLMADRQTTGGYPQIGVVITVDLPTVAQLAPGDWIEFRFCSPAEARAARSGPAGGA